MSRDDKWPSFRVAICHPPASKGIGLRNLEVPGPLSQLRECGDIWPGLGDGGRLGLAELGYANDSECCCAQQDQDQHPQKREFVGGELWNAARGHSQNAHEGAEQAEVAAGHETAVSFDVSFPDGPQASSQCAEGQY